MKKRLLPASITIQQKGLMLACVVVGIAIVATVAYQSLFQRPDLPSVTPKPDTPDKEQSQTVEPKEEWEEYSQPKVSGERKSDDFYTFLVLGRDTGGGGNTDTMMVASYDVTNQNVTVVNIPRDTMINVPWDVKKINSVYNWYGGGEKGIQALNHEISELIGFVPDYQIVVEWDAIEEMVDAIGGVWFDVPCDMHYNDPYQDLIIDVDAGYQELDGNKAMQVIRWRHDNNYVGYPNGDLGRIQTQQAFLTAVAKQVLSIKNVTKINELVEVFQKNVETELSISNLLWFGKSAILGGLNMDNIHFVTLPTTSGSVWSRSYEQNLSYVMPKAKEILALINDHLSPYAQEVTLNELDIMYKNSDGSLSSTAGTVADTPSASPPVYPEEEEEEPEVPDTETPEVPDVPDTDGSETPENPDEPDTDNPDVDEPENPENPTPDDPTPEPENPENPASPEEPTPQDPATPQEPEVPAEPSTEPSLEPDLGGLEGFLSPEEIAALQG